MRKTYQVLANAIAVLVVVQAGAIAWAFLGLSNEIDQNGLVINKACLESDSGCGGGFTAEWGFAIHMFFNGTILIPLVTIVLLIVSFFAKVPRGTVLAVVIVVSIAVQVAAGITADSMPYIGLIHGLNAFILFGSALAAASAAETASTAESVPAAAV